MGEGNGRSGNRVKVVRVVETYGLDGVGEELEMHWTADGDERMSLRDLAAYLNRRVLAAVMREAGMRPLEGEVENVYRLLTDEDVSSAERTRTRRRLEREGVDVSTMLDDFVTYQAVRTYLTEHRDAAYEETDRDGPTDEVEHIGRLRGRVASVTESKLDRLERDGHLTLGDVRTFVDVNVFCERCGAQYEAEELLERGGCDCPE